MAYNTLKTSVGFDLLENRYEAEVTAEDLQRIRAFDSSSPQAAVLLLMKKLSDMLGSVERFDSESKARLHRSKD